MDVISQGEKIVPGGIPNTLMMMNLALIRKAGSDHVRREKGYSRPGKAFDRGCICPDCPVIPVHGWKNQTSCLWGSKPAWRYVNPVPIAQMKE